MGDPKKPPENETPLARLCDAVCYECDVGKAWAVLEQTGVNVDARLDDGSTVLLNVVTPDECGDLLVPDAVWMMVVFLLAKGADPALRDNAGNNALDRAQALLDPDWRDVFGSGYPSGWFEEHGYASEQIVNALRHELGSRG